MDPNGNYYTVKYYYDSPTGAYYPLQIVYTNNDGAPLPLCKTVQFSYEARTDCSAMYSPTLVELQHRLKWVAVLSGTTSSGTGGSLIRKYRMDYIYASTPQSEMTTVQEYGNDGNVPPEGMLTTAFTATGSVLPPFNFSWASGGSGFQGWTWSSGARLVTDTAQIWLADVTGNGKQDLVCQQNGGIIYVALSGQGFDGTTGNVAHWDWDSGPQMVDVSSSSNKALVWLADVNGDGKADLVNIGAASGGDAGYVWVALSGSGFCGTNGQCHWDWGSGRRMVDTDSTIQLADVTGDGKAALVVTGGPSDITYAGWVFVALSGQGFCGINGTFDWDWNSGGVWVYNGSNVLLGDVNGDGECDFVSQCPAGYGNSGYVYVGHPLYSETLLTGITLSAGGTVAVTYTPAAQVPGAVVPANSSYPVVANASARPLVTNIKVTDGLANTPTISTSYQYFNGLYLSGLPQDQTDLGFQTVTKTDGNTGTKTVTTFSQNVPLQGMPIDTLVLDSSGNKFGETANTYAARTDNPNFPTYANLAASSPPVIESKVQFVYPASQTTKRYDGQANSTNTKVTYDSYDAQGNLLQTTNLGVVNSSGVSQTPNVVDTYTYASSSTQVLSRMTRHQTYGYDNTGLCGLAKETDYFYDGSTTLGAITIGRPTKVQSVIDSNGDVAASSMTYDSWGNVLTTTDPSGIVTSQVNYDSNYHSLVTSTTDARGLTTTVTARNPSLEPTVVTDPQGNSTTSVFDVFGRPTATVSALLRDSVSSPTTQNIYSDTPSFPSTPVSVATNQKSTGTTYFPSYTYYDGLGRVVQTKSQSTVAGAQFVTQDYFYDGSGRNCKVSNPYITSSGAFSYNALDTAQLKTVFTFDALGRATQTSYPDTTTSLTKYNQNLTTTADQLGHVKQVEDDINVRIQRSYTGVYPNQLLYTTVTAKTYRGGSQIIDGKGNTITAVTDMIGRKTSCTDPDMGSWSYLYNPNSSLAQQTDANGSVISFTYDFAGRILQKLDGSTVAASYSYGTSGWQNGMLSSITVGANTTSYTYNQYGQTTQVNKTIGTYGTRSEIRSYNADGRLGTRQFPNGGETVTYGYSPEGIPNTLSGNSSYLASETIDSFGRVSSQTFGNGTATTLSFDPTTFRTTGMVTPGVLSLGYTYDALGDIQTKTDNLNASASETYTYDEQNRLVTATGIYGSRTYLYDSLNNLLGQNGTAVNTYTGTGPHAVSGDGTSTYAYDSDGNMVSRTTSGSVDRNFSYDAENRLVSTTVAGSTTSYAYDDTRQRVTLTQGSTTTVFWFPDYEEIFSGGSLYDSVKSYSVRGKKIAQSGQINGLLYLYGDQLGSTSKVMNTSGVVTAKYYEPYGKLAVSDDGKVRQLFTGQDWDPSADLYYYNARFYEPALGRFIQADTVLDGLNRYSYCGDNPTSNIDPTGNDYILLHDTKGFLGFLGHVGVLIGSDTTKWTYFSFDGTDHIDQATATRSHFDKAKIKFDTLKDFEKYNSTFLNGRYSYGQQVITGGGQDNAMKGVATGLFKFDPPYFLLISDCVHAAIIIGSAGGVVMWPGPGDFIPNLTTPMNPFTQVQLSPVQNSPTTTTTNNGSGSGHGSGQSSSTPAQPTLQSPAEPGLTPSESDPRDTSSNTGNTGTPEATDGDGVWDDKTNSESVNIGVVVF